MANESIAPVFGSASIPANGLSLAIVLVEVDSPPIQLSSPTPGFTVLVDSVEREITGVTASGVTVTLALATAVQQNQTVRVSYDNTSESCIDSADTPNVLTSFTNQTVSNNSTVLDVTAPDVPAPNVEVKQRIIVTWEPVPYATYRVYRDGVLDAELASDELEYADNDEAAGQTRTFSVTAVDLSGNESPKSAPIKVVYEVDEQNKTVRASVKAPDSQIFIDKYGKRRNVEGDLV